MMGGRERQPAATAALLRSQRYVAGGDRFSRGIATGTEESPSDLKGPSKMSSTLQGRKSLLAFLWRCHRL